MAREANLGDAQLVLASLSTSSRTDVSGCSSRESLSINPRKTNLSLLFLNSLVLSQVQFRTTPAPHPGPFVLATSRAIFDYQNWEQGREARNAAKSPTVRRIDPHPEQKSYPSQNSNSAGVEKRGLKSTSFLLRASLSAGKMLPVSSYWGSDTGLCHSAGVMG